MKCCAPKLALKKRNMTTRKWAIQFQYRDNLVLLAEFAIRAEPSVYLLSSAN